MNMFQLMTGYKTRKRFSEKTIVAFTNSRVFILHYMTKPVWSFWPQVESSHVINVFRRQGCPHLGQGHGPIASSRRSSALPDHT